MDSLCGRWQLVSAENVGEYCDAIGCTPESRAKALQFLTPENNIVQEISLADNDVTIVTTVPTRTIETKGVLGQPTDVSFMDGRELKTVYSIEDGKLREDQSGAFTSTNFRFRDGDSLIMTMTSNGVTTKRTYRKA